MQAIWSIVGVERIVAAVQVVQDRVGNAVGGAADGFANIGRVARAVDGRGGEREDDILRTRGASGMRGEVEGVEDGALGEDGDGGGGL